MRAYIIRRVLLMIPTLLLVTIMVFFLIRLIPGDVIDAIMAAPGAGDVEYDRASLEKDMGLDAPLLTQYGRWLGVVRDKDGDFSGLFQGNLGYSWWRKVTVISLVAEKWPVTLELALFGIIIAQSIALPIGIYSALRQDHWGDYIGRSIAIGAISIPSFWMATLVIVFPSIWWGYMPSIMLIRLTEDLLGNLKMFIVPAMVLGLAMSGMTMRMTRTMMLEVLRQDYIRTAWAKGLRERIIVTRHALKNALIPVVTIVGLSMPSMIGGTVIIEQIFCLPGMGRLIIGATLNRDHALMSGVIFLFAIALMLINLGVDLTYAYLDPRVRYK